MGTTPRQPTACSATSPCTPATSSSVSHSKGDVRNVERIYPTQRATSALSEVRARVAAAEPPPVLQFQPWQVRHPPRVVPQARVRPESNGVVPSPPGIYPGGRTMGGAAVLLLPRTTPTRLSALHQIQRALLLGLREAAPRLPLPQLVEEEAMVRALALTCPPRRCVRRARWSPRSGRRWRTTSWTNTVCLKSSRRCTVHAPTPRFSLGDAKSSLGDAKSSRWVTLRARWVTLSPRRPRQSSSTRVCASPPRDPLLSAVHHRASFTHTVRQ
jgi:hypothetical protein